MEPRTITLRDGRRLAWAEYGPADGTPVLLFHGTPGCRLDHDPFDRPTTVRTIVPDRPGFGCSDPQPGRRLVDWPDDVAQLADALGLERFHVAGISGGGPYALVCAAMLPERVQGVGLICAVGPLSMPELREGLNEQNRMSDELARNAPEMLVEVCEGMAAGVKADAEAAFANGGDTMVPVDRATFETPAVKAMLMASHLEAFRQNGRCLAEDLIIHSSPWGFDPSVITAPVLMVHGALDQNVPLSNAEYLARVIPGAQLEVLPDDAHLSVAIHHSVPLSERLVG